MNANTNNEKALLQKISDLESELKKIKRQKKYGLVWEDKPEQIVEDCKRNVPILRLKEKKKGIDPVITRGPLSLFKRAPEVGIKNHSNGAVFFFRNLVWLF